MNRGEWGPSVGITWSHVCDAKFQSIHVKKHVLDLKIDLQNLNIEYYSLSKNHENVLEIVEVDLNGGCFFTESYGMSMKQFFETTFSRGTSIIASLDMAAQLVERLVHLNSLGYFGLGLNPVNILENCIIWHFFQYWKQRAAIVLHSNCR